MSGKVHAPTRPLMAAEQASQLLDHVVHQRVRELIDFCCLLDFEQELRHALRDCGLPRAEIRLVSAQLISRALTRIGEEHIKLVSEPPPSAPIGEPSVRS